jgi:hypothetical protein
MRARLLVPFLVLAAAAACDEKKTEGRPVPTPGPQIVVREISSASGGPEVERGERIRFLVIGTGAGTHFGAQTFLHSPALADLTVVAVESSARLWAQGLVSFAAGEGNKDLAVVSGDELAVAPWAFAVRRTFPIDLGRAPADSRELTGDANVIDPAGDVDVYTVAPPTDAVQNLNVRVDAAGFEPSLELYRVDGRLAAHSDSGCASVAVRSRQPVFVRVSDRSGAGSPAHTYRVSAAFGLPDACLAASPGDLVPVPAN